MLQIIMQYNQNGDPNLVTLLQNSICGYNGFDIMVCCPSPKLDMTTPLLFFTDSPAPSTAVTFAPIINAANQPPSSPNPGWGDPQTFAPINFSQLPPSQTPTTLPGAIFPGSSSSSGITLPTFERDQCGMSNATHSRVVGGIPAQANAWPWMALVGYKTSLDSNPRFLCGGTLITQKHVITAAHCVKESL